MSESQMQPGWYYAQGDAPGTQRYWDGSQWVGGPQPVGQPQDALATMGPGTPSEWVKRFIAWLIDSAIVFAMVIVLVILIAIGSAISDNLGAVITIVGYLGIIAFQIWNLVLRQGRIGQTIGKTQQNIKLVRDDTGQPVGAGMAFVRALVAGLLAGLTCYIYGLLDYLWPLWDAEKKRLTDKIFSFSVVDT